ncbi:MAG: DUF4179 domain-containing protein [Ruminococcus sp.]|nr:DUF4179 domain-containing protein [Ruminococcus sp.]
MTLHEYRSALDQITTSEEEKAMKAKQMYAKSEEAVGTPMVKRRKTAWIAAAAAVAVLAGTTLSVGAAVKWDYRSLFDKYFSEQTPETQPVTYVDLTGMGLDLNESVDFDGFTLHMKSVVADSTALYAMYDITLHDVTAFGGEIYDIAPVFVVNAQTADGKCIMNSTGTPAQKITDDTYRLVNGYTLSYPKKDSLKDASITIGLYGVTVISDTTTTLKADYTRQLDNAFISDSMTITKAVDFAIPHYEPYRASSVSISPFALHLTADPIKDDFMPNKEALHAGDWVIKAIYNDGTEQLLSGDIINNLKKDAITGESLGADFNIFLDYPVNTGEITAISIDGIILPLA